MEDEEKEKEKGATRTLSEGRKSCLLLPSLLARVVAREAATCRIIKSECAVAAILC